MTDPLDDTHDSRPDPSEKIKNQSLKSEAESLSDDFDAVGIADEDELLLGSSSKTERVPPPSTDAMPKEKATLPSGIGYPAPPLAMVETAFLASTSSLIWLINYYFPLGPLLRMFFPIPIALVYLRWGKPCLLDGSAGFGVVAVGTDGADSQRSVCHSLWSHGRSTGCDVETWHQLAIFN